MSVGYTSYLPGCPKGQRGVWGGQLHPSVPRRSPPFPSPPCPSPTHWAAAGSMTTITPPWPKATSLASFFLSLHRKEQVTLALQLVSTNLKDVVQQIDSSLGDFIDAGLMVCEAFKPYPKCMLMIEEIVCGTTCNPDSGSYVSKSPSGEFMMTVCPEFANATYDTCKDVEISGFALNLFIPNADAMMTMVVSNVIAVMGVTNFNITIAPGACFTGATATPAYTPCCDPLAVDPKCPAGSVDTVKYAPYINRNIDSAACMTGAPMPAPGPSTSTPPAPGPAPPTAAPPTVAPPTAAPPTAVPPTPAAPAPAPPAPTAGGPPPSPQTPGVAPSTPPASPSPTPVSPSPPPPPPKSGAGSAASVMSVVALAVGAAVVFV
ncbi:unnamed protein product [Closterium sp. Naga37s-1]|nr:unnamed protein product [Closterium sp. Naga37s-1]